MQDDSWHVEIGPVLRTMQIIVCGLTMGLLIYLSIIVFAFRSHANPAAVPGLMTMLAGFIVLTGLIARTIVMGSIAKRGRHDIANGVYPPTTGIRLDNSVRIRGSEPAPGPSRAAQYLLAVYRSRMIVSTALFEGWAFFATTAFILEGSLWAIGLASILLVCVAAHFPTRSRVVGWIGRQLELIQLEKLNR